MKKIALPVLTVCFALAALVFAYLWYVEKSNDSDLKQLAQASATDAYTQFSSYQTNGNDSDYWSGVASFRSFEQAYVLLVQGTWDAIGKVSRNTRDWVVLGEPESQASKVTIDYKAPVAAVIMIAMIIALVFSDNAPVFIVLTAGVLMMLAGCFRTIADAYRTINWESIVLIAAMMPMSVALEKTGTSAMLSHSLVASLGSVSPTILLAGIYFTTSLLTMFISNTATAVLMALSLIHISEPTRP